MPWQLGVAALAIGVGIFFLLRAGDDFNQWVITLMWFAVGIYWIIDWRRDVKKRRRLSESAPGHH